MAKAQMAETQKDRAQTDGRVRAVIDSVRPCVDGGRFAIKRIEGDRVSVEADCFTDGHDALRVMLCWRKTSASDWQECEMSPAPTGNDVWCGEFVAEAQGQYVYRIDAWVDSFLSWQRDFARRNEAEDIAVAAQVGAGLIESIAARAANGSKTRLLEWAKRLRDAADTETRRSLALDAECLNLAADYPDRTLAAHSIEFPLTVDRKRARFGAWYELFPRSASAAADGRHGTLNDVIKQLDYVAELGFDVLYLPPIHPIGRSKRKGKNNTLDAQADDVGSPWAIGAAEGGHTAIHPLLGTLDDFRRLVREAGERNIELALDIAFQCAPDHPWVKEHPQWFLHRPDGSVQYAENPPKKYQDIYPFNFETPDWQALWSALKGVFDFWIDAGVHIFRVDNPHTKSFAFWEWVIAAIKAEHPDIIFLAEAFTRPKVMHRLAKLGYTQSYTYFAWRNTKQELTDYFTELALEDGREYFRPNVWPNTPDILTEALQFGGRPVFMARLVLAATLSSNYGIYGPAYELQEAEPVRPGSEEYLHSEKYQLRQWTLNRPDSLAAFVGLINRIRRDNPALHADWQLRFHHTDNDQLICYSKHSEDGQNLIVVVVNLDPGNTHSGWVQLDLDAIGIQTQRQFQMHDLITGARYLWHGARNYISLDPHRSPAHIFHVRRHTRRENDFDYFL